MKIKNKRKKMVEKINSIPANKDDKLDWCIKEIKSLIVENIKISKDIEKLRNR